MRPKEDQEKNRPMQQEYYENTATQTAEKTRPLKTIHVPRPPADRRPIKTIHLPPLRRGSPDAASPLETIRFRPIPRYAASPRV